MATTEVIFVILIGLIGVGVGIAIGMLLLGARSDKPERDDQPKSRTNMIEVATVWQDRKSGKLYPEVNGKIVRYPAEMSASQRERLVSQLGSLLDWLRPAAREKGGQPASEVASTDPEGIVPDTTASMPVQAPAKPRISPIDLMARAVQPDTRPLEKPPQSIAAQIDEILQEKLSGSSLDNRGIRLMELPVKGMVIMVGLEQYPDIDAVPDEEIRKMIRESVAEWEQRSVVE
jgi:hypothetical protein